MLVQSKELADRQNNEENKIMINNSLQKQNIDN